MTRRALSSLGKMVEEKRGDSKLRETAQEIGISPATLLRIENGRIPDVATFGKVCRWLDVDPGEFLGFESKGSGPAIQKTLEQPVSISAHFRADSTPKPETAQALARMLLFAMTKQPQPNPALDNGDV